MPEGDRKPGGSPLVSDLRGVMLREHLGDLMPVHQPQVSSLEGLSCYQHTDELIEAFRKARDFARFIEQTEGTPQKLCFANYDWAVI